MHIELCPWDKIILECILNVKITTSIGMIALYCSIVFQKNVCVYKI